METAKEPCAFLVIKSNGKDKCKALTCLDCANCSFRKTEEELNQGRNKATKRIQRKPKIERDYILEKYYQ